MSYEEALGWYAYFEKFPEGWKEDSRAFKLLQAQGVKAAPETIFPTLAPIYASTKAEKPKVSKASMFYALISSSVGGVKLKD